MNVVYHLLLLLYWPAANIASLFNKKARFFVSGRRGNFARLKQELELKRGGKKIAWFHCASLGEFEQGKPVIEAFRSQYPEYQVLLTFFSPSGYEHRKNYAGADYVFYLPMDFRWNAHRFVKLVQPSVVIFVKYEYWYNFLHELKRAGVKTYIVSAIFRKEQIFFNPFVGYIFRRALRCFNDIFVQDKKSQELLSTIGITNGICAGDTRFDRVAAVAAQPREVPVLERFAENKVVLVAGSTWPQDNDLLVSLANKHEDLHVIFVPHEIHESQLISLEKALAGTVIRLSALLGKAGKGQHIEPFRHVIVDAIGYLSSLYKLATYTYVGGGFGAGIHNTLEAAVYGKPVFFGANYQKFAEAKDLIAQGGAFSVATAQALDDLYVRMQQDKPVYETACAASKNYVQHKVGATSTIMQHLQEENFL
ncbi:MAG: 3-deoxy-D-manno-octulosonic acid transferase [Prevotellaceae bacterium]|nr:3-deoxy-D-manno-octulosonic acid transferase [Prevotellaceae bacterium]